MYIVVVALGKIGLPLAVQYADEGHKVIGVDVDPAIVETVNAGTEPFPGEAHLTEESAALSPATGNGALRAAADYAEAIPETDAIVLVVPLFVNDATWRSDFTWMGGAIRPLAVHLTPNTLTSYETALPVGTPRSYFRPMIEEISSLKEGADFHLVFSPEQVLTGRVFTDLRRYPELAGGLDEAGTQAGIVFYESVLDFDERDDLPRPNGVWDMGTARVAEMVKPAGTTYRDVNTGPTNQLAAYADKISLDTERVIKTYNSQLYSHAHRPDIAMGRHCIPVYPRLHLSTNPDASVVRTARTFDVAMPAYVVDWAIEVFGSLKGPYVVMPGAPYRDKVKETVFSGVFPIVEALREIGVEVLVHDPTYADEELAGFGWTPYHLGERVGVAIVQADHPEYGESSTVDLPGLRFLLDGRRTTDAAKWTGVPRLTIGGGE